MYICYARSMCGLLRSSWQRFIFIVTGWYWIKTWVSSQTKLDILLQLITSSSTKPHRSRVVGPKVRSVRQQQRSSSTARSRMRRSSCRSDFFSWEKCEKPEGLWLDDLYQLYHYSVRNKSCIIRCKNRVIGLQDWFTAKKHVLVLLSIQNNRISGAKQGGLAERLRFQQRRQESDPQTDVSNTEVWFCWESDVFFFRFLDEQCSKNLVGWWYA